MKELQAPWPLADGTLAALGAGQETSLAIRTGLPYLGLRLALAQRSLFVLTDEERAENWALDAKALAAQFPELSDWSVGFLPAGAPKERNALLEESLQKQGLLWFGSPEALREPTFSKEAFQRSRLQLKAGRAYNYTGIIDHLSHFSYERVHFVEEPGEFATRGEIFDFWSPNSERPVRVIFHNDVIESMHFFDPGSQRALEFVAETVALPLAERRLGASQQEGSVIQFLPERTLALLDFPHLPPEEGESDKLFGARPLITVDPAGADAGLAPPSRVHLNWKFFKRELEANAEKGVRSLVFCQNMGEAQRLEEILDQVRSPRAHWPGFHIAALQEGFASEELKLAVWTFGELVGAPVIVRRLPKFKMGRALDSMSEIHAGDYIVHERYGIGRYRGLERVNLKLTGHGSRPSQKEKVSEFLALEYRGGDRLLVPIQDFRLVQKFVGQEGKKPQLNSLDRASWERVKERVRQEIAEMAQDLLETAALRAAAARGSDQPAEQRALQEHLQKEFAEAFPYEETPDQKRAIAEIEKDLDSSVLMDRVVCGDVGYGKTEIAMRAAFKVASEGRQVLVLVPTTILAEQHFKTFTQRFAAFPLRLGMISRFQKPADQKDILNDLKHGALDILIGTHRLLQKDVRPEDLGLIIVDEEHRFGVQQKESLKKLKLAADILSLSATPIPRTLSQSMGGIREISVIETPPEGRLPIETHVGLFDEDQVRGAIRRELSRGGQVFYVHNRISTIETRRALLEKLLPGLRVGLAHGQMSADALESAMWNFLHKKWDVLLSTSIIESGLDIPSVNTLIVEDSEEFGLAQLYQLRGRVGRKKEKAYCYLFFSNWSNLSRDARKRLDAIQEFSALGSGMKLAVRDLEIRGTGNLLGPQQHGWINAVGLDLYCQMLAEEVRRLKEERGIVLTDRERERLKEEVARPEIELEVPAFIPEEYVEFPGERIALYKKLIACRAPEDLDKLKSELQDRFGPLPEPAQNLLRIGLLRLEVAQAGVSSVTETERGLILGWALRNGNLPLDLAGLAGEFADQAEVLPPDPAEDKKEIAILFTYKEGAAEGGVFERVKNILQRTERYVIIP